MPKPGKDVDFKDICPLGMSLCHCIYFRCSKTLEACNWHYHRVTVLFHHGTFHEGQYMTKPKYMAQTERLANFLQNLF